MLSQARPIKSGNVARPGGVERLSRGLEAERPIGSGEFALSGVITESRPSDQHLIGPRAY